MLGVLSGGAVIAEKKLPPVSSMYQLTSPPRCDARNGWAQY
jgi:hypothetical protein